MGSVVSARDLRPATNTAMLVVGNGEAPRRVDEALGRVLEAFPSAAYVVRGTTIHPANAVARERLAVDHASLARRLVYAAAHDRNPDGYAWISVEEGFVALEQERAADTRWERTVTRWGLSQRQAEVLRGLLDGLSNAEIARTLGCKPRTVESHVAAIRQRADASSRLEVVAAYWAEE